MMKTIENYLVDPVTKQKKEDEKMKREEEEKKRRKPTPPAPAKPTPPPAPAPAKPTPPAPAPAKPTPPAVKPKKTKSVYDKFEMFEMYYDPIGMTVDNLISLLIFGLAVYLSWTCNSKNTPGMDVVEKVVRAGFAGMFGFFYLIIYFLVWADQCNKQSLSRV